MALFGQRKKKTTTEAGATVDAAPTSGPTSAPTEQASPEWDRSGGPFDAAEKTASEGYLDFGGFQVLAPEGSHVRLDVDQAADTIVAATIDIGASSLQIQAFAAPKSSGLWDEIRGQIQESVAGQGGSSEVIEGDFGVELFVKLPVTSQDGSLGYRSARFLGVDGPRWFVRGVLGGPAATDEREAAPLVDVFRSIIVVRGDAAMPPKELLTLRVPEGAQTV
ncbi:DUF3710 domain-containing protein [Falsarthrobacter nasiphocae]|uniref:DUF3710 domain-containing protein n=1 Tax=Falsarthrobacter nasiphocae TaxID=189863 RepID=A0AAE4C696_9MICC|nr:DUF3710 domain-containing protein [Falsarthrobacter nasiphocae]MDR6891264.1 hypothetical protein [Falsarthrobacter nasiphocae]